MLAENPAWQALMRMPIVDDRTEEERAEWQRGLDDIAAGRFKAPARPRDVASTETI